MLRESPRSRFVSQAAFIKHVCDLSLGHQPTSMRETKALSAFPESNENNILWPLQDDTCSEPGAGIPGDPNIPSNYVRQFLALLQSTSLRQHKVQYVMSVEQTPPLHAVPVIP